MTEPQPDPNVALPIHCYLCGQAVEVLAILDDREDVVTASYTCPWCEQVNTVPLGGVVTSVTRRSGGDRLGRLLPPSGGVH